MLPGLAKLLDAEAGPRRADLANSVARELNPFRAPARSRVCSTRPTFRCTSRPSASRQPAAAVFKGGGGEGQRNPDKPCRVLEPGGGEPLWPALTPGAG